MKYHQIDSQLFIDTRKNYKARLKSNSVAVFNSNDLMPTNADGTMAFRQNNDIFYLSGVDQEESILVLAPDAVYGEHREMLFVRETNDTIAVWEGEKLTKARATEVSGIQNVYWLEDFDRLFGMVMANADSLYLNGNEHARATIEVETREVRCNAKYMKQYPLINIERSAPILHDLRAIKHPIEIELMQHACNITEKGVRRIMEFIKPGVWEYEIEAEFSHEFLRNRSRGFAYTPIIASGNNACVLHYIENNLECKDGDVILMDVGAEYANYASDLTRCFPVSGKFTDRQKDVYNAVLRVMRAAMNLLKPGVYLKDYHAEVGKLMETELLGLGLITAEEVANQDPAKPAFKKYFMHGTSHFIGLDVHDVGHWTKPIAAGMVFTVEPGIYIPAEDLGIRLENDILITENGFTDLMGNIPLEADEIEACMAAQTAVAV
jgi:Xaa-Pro aminopeptidase